jgi:trehalose-6-phosphatase
MQAQARADARLALLVGKMVAALIFGGQTKGDAVARLMAQPGFAGRLPWFAGDGVANEAAFRHVNMLGGITIKIGTGSGGCLSASTWRDSTRHRAKLLMTRRQQRFTARNGTGSSGWIGWTPVPQISRPLPRDVLAPCDAPK